MLVVLFACITAACEKDGIQEQEIEKVHFKSKKSLNFSRFDFLYSQANYEKSCNACYGVDLKGKSIAYIGGSIASLPESDIAKALVYEAFNQPDIFTYGKGGHGFATSPLSFQNQVRCCSSHDIYIIWCSTNDYYTGVPQGEVTDYTEYDGWDEAKLSTQCGGMNYCITYLRQLNPNAIIVGMTSLPFFGVNAERTEGYMTNSPKYNMEGINFYQYTQVQQQIFENHKIPYLNQWELNLFSPESYSLFYKDDGVHFTEEGYFLIGCAQLRFLAEVLKEMGIDASVK